MYKLDSRGLQEEPVIVIVGVGGTGAFVAEGVCRILGNKSATMVLVDHDRVEPHNLRRQAFYADDIGEFKAKLVAERLSRQFAREVGYTVYPYSKELHYDVFMRRRSFPSNGLIIGCVDNPAARQAMTDSVEDQWWIDAGNGEHSGQVLIGNTKISDNLRGAFVASHELCTSLPLPTIQSPDLLAPVPHVEATLDCAEAVEAGDQSATINQAMASLTVDYFHRLLSGTLPWMGTYLDMELGTMRPVQAEPKAVARMTGRTQKFLTDKVARPTNSGQWCEGCRRYHW